MLGKEAPRQILRRIGERADHLVFVNAACHGICDRHRCCRALHVVEHRHGDTLLAWGDFFGFGGEVVQGGVDKQGPEARA